MTNYRHANRIQWGMTTQGGEVVGLRPDGVLALASRWVSEYAAEAGNFPGVRSCHYALIALCAEAGLVYRNTTDAYTTLVRHTAALRRLGLFPPFEDSTRWIDTPLSFRSAEHRMTAALRSMLLDRTEGQPWQTWVVVEKRGLRGRVVTWTEHLGLPVVPLGGFGSETLERKVRQAIRRDGRPSRGLFVSDFDPSGLLLSDVFQRHVGFDQVERVALTAEQVDDLDLPTDPAPEEDSRLAWFREQTGRDVQVEVDALDALHPGVLEDSLRAEIEAEWDEDAHAAALDREWREGWRVAVATEFVAMNSEQAA